MILCQHIPQNPSGQSGPGVPALGVTFLFSSLLLSFLLLSDLTNVILPAPQRRASSSAVSAPLTHREGNLSHTLAASPVKLNQTTRRL